MTELQKEDYYENINYRELLKLLPDNLLSTFAIPNTIFQMVLRD